MNKEYHYLESLENWYASQCDGDWEHEFGIKIDTLDNPGWSLVIDLFDTDLEERHFEEVNYQNSEFDWIQCCVKNKQFQAFGGIKNLTQMIRIFVLWKEYIK